MTAPRKPGDWVGFRLDLSLFRINPNLVIVSMTLCDSERGFWMEPIFQIYKYSYAPLTQMRSDCCDNSGEDTRSCWQPEWETLEFVCPFWTQNLSHLWCDLWIGIYLFIEKFRGVRFKMGLKNPDFFSARKGIAEKPWRLCRKIGKASRRESHLRRGVSSTLNVDWGASVKVNSIRYPFAIVLRIQISY